MARGVCNGPHGLYLAPFHCYTQRDAISRNATFSPLKRYESAVPTVPVDNVRLLDTRGGAEQEARDICMRAQVHQEGANTYICQGFHYVNYLQEPLPPRGCTRYAERSDRVRGNVGSSIRGHEHDIIGSVLTKSA